MRWAKKRLAPAGTRGLPLMQGLDASLVQGCAGTIFICTMHVWECMQSPVGFQAGMCVPTDEHGLL
jgi:hypothetical protein